MCGNSYRAADRSKSVYRPMGNEVAMTVAELIEHLQKLPQDILVRAFDPDSKMLQPVSGYLVHALAVDLQTDQIDD